MHHYRFMAERTAPTFFDEMTAVDQCVLWNAASNQRNFEITLSSSSIAVRREGDLNLCFQADGVSIYDVSFSVISGRLVGSNLRGVVLIGRVQGARGQSDLIREATKFLEETSPAHMLMIAVEAIASQLAISEMRRHMTSFADLFSNGSTYWHRMSLRAPFERPGWTPLSPTAKPGG